MGFPWPGGVDEVPLLSKMDGNTAHFIDGTTRHIDAVVLCTGYRHNFPYIEDALRLQTKNDLYPPNLYRGVFWLDNPKMMYLGMQDRYYTFTLFDLEAFAARDFVLGGHRCLHARSWQRTSILGGIVSRPSMGHSMRSTSRLTTCWHSALTLTTQTSISSSPGSSSTNGSTTRRLTSLATGTRASPRQSRAQPPRSTTLRGGRPSMTQWRRSWEMGHRRTLFQILRLWKRSSSRRADCVHGASTGVVTRAETAGVSEIQAPKRILLGPCWDLAPFRCPVQVVPGICPGAVVSME